MTTFQLSPSQIARYFFHDCQRHLRFFATPSAARKAEGIPAPEHSIKKLHEPLLQAGHLWEERVITKHLGRRVRVAKSAKPNTPLHDRTFSVEESLPAIETLKPGQFVYQPTLAAPQGFVSRFGLAPDLVQFAPCRPDLIELVQSENKGQDMLRIHDIKASQFLKPTHQIQTAIYALILESVLVDADTNLRVDLRTAGIWLNGTPEPELFDLTRMVRTAKTFLQDELPAILSGPAKDVPWHLHFRCEWCEFYARCRAQAEKEQSVSLLPGLSVRARHHFRDGANTGKPINTIPELQRLLKQKDVDSCLETCGSLQGKAEKLRKQVEALQRGQPVALSGRSIALPVWEDVKLWVTLHREPTTGKVYAAGFLRRDWSSNERRVFVERDNYQIFVAESPDECADVCSDFIAALHDELRTIHEANQGREFKRRASFQTYVFDSFERDLLLEMLLAGLHRPETAEAALGLLFHYQDPALANADEHPENGVIDPVIVLSRAIRSVVALPVAVSPHLPGVVEAMEVHARRSGGSKAFAYPYPPESSAFYYKYFLFPLSNLMKSDAIQMAWSGDRPEAIGWVKKAIHSRLCASDVVLQGVRKFLEPEGSLIAWPPRLLLPDHLGIRDPLISKLAFVSLYESLLGAVQTRQRRAVPIEERIREGFCVRVKRRKDGDWKVLSETEASWLEISGFPKYILVPDTDDGEKHQLLFNDLYYRTKLWNPKGGSVRLAAITQVEPLRGRAQVLTLEVKERRGEPFGANETAMILPRFTDFIGKKIIEQLRNEDADPASAFKALLRSPTRFQRSIREDSRACSAWNRLLPEAKLTPSQEKAAKRFFGQRLALVWGPPGTGKTHFLGATLLALARARFAARKPLRICISAFTHAAVEKALSKCAELAKCLGVSSRVKIVKLERLATQLGEELERTDARQLQSLNDEFVIAGGTVYALKKVSAGWADVLVVDEASQMKLGELSLALTVWNPDGRLMLVGDDLQLPPILSGVYPEPDDKIAGVHESAFRYLRARDSKRMPFTHQLLEDFRMTWTLNRFAAETLYGDAYKPVSKRVAARQLKLRKSSSQSKNQMERFLTECCDPARPLVVGILEDIQATGENVVEAELVARIACHLREQMLPSVKRSRAVEKADREFWRHKLFIVSPHHVQIQAIKDKLHRFRKWSYEPFVDTVDKMQGQEADAVIVSYGLSDAETAASEANFIYSLNRLNVSVTRAKAKAIVFLPRPLLTPSFDTLADKNAAAGLGHMLALIDFCGTHGESQQAELRGLDCGLESRITLLRANIPPPVVS